MSWAAEIARLDEVIAATWPAPESKELDGWRLRFGHGFTGKANSVWPQSHDGTVPVADKITAVEAYYRSRGLRPKVQLSPASQPAGLEEEFAARGYERSTEVLIETLDSAPDIGLSGDVEVTREPDARWLDVWFAVRGYPRSEAARLLPMLGGDAMFARIDEVAVGRAAAHGDRVAITSMATLPEARRRGCARSILGVLAAWAFDRGPALCLAVEASNAPARALYEGVGFAPVYGYWYRTAPE